MKKKIKIRCLEHFITLPNGFLYKIFIVLNGGWVNYKLFQCRSCEEILVFDSFDGSSLIQNGKHCPNCDITLKNNLIEYPKQLSINGEIIDTMVNFDTIENIENSEMKEFYLLDS